MRRCYPLISNDLENRLYFHPHEQCGLSAYGVNAGMSGRSGRFVLNLGTHGEKILPSLQDGVTLETEDILQIAMPGSGGYGHPFDRERERVLRYVLANFVSSESALEDYGVVLDVESEAVDLAATRDHRAAHR